MLSIANFWSFEVLKLAVLVGVNVYIADYIVSYQLLVGLPGLACVHLPTCTFTNSLVVKIPTKITAIVSQAWLDVDFYIELKLYLN
jgi:hypothetical protein